MGIKTLLADDHPVLLLGMTRILESAGFEVVATCGNGVEAVEEACKWRPDIAVLDVRMPKLSGLEAARQIRLECPPTRIVLLSGALKEEDTLAALRIGVEGVLLKGTAVDQVIKCLHDVHAGQQWVDHHSTVQALRGMLQRASTLELEAVLTRRQRQILHLMTQGLRNQEIANNLRVTEGTVKVHLHNIYEKLKVDGRMALMRHVQEKGLLPAMSS